MPTMSESVPSFDIPDCKNIVIHLDQDIPGPLNIQLDQDTRGPVNILLKVNHKGNNASSLVSNSTGYVSSRKSCVPDHLRRQDSYKFYNPHRNNDTHPIDGSTVMAEIQKWADWRRKANFRMAAVIIDKVSSDKSRTTNIITETLDSETIFNMYKTQRSSDSSSSVLGIKSFSMYGIPRIQHTSAFDGSRGLHMNDLQCIPPDYDDSHYQEIS